VQRLNAQYYGTRLFGGGMITSMHIVNGYGLVTNLIRLSWP